MISKHGDDALIMLCRRIQEINGVAQALARVSGNQKCSGRRVLVFPNVNPPEPANRAAHHGIVKVEVARKIKHAAMDRYG